MRGLRRSIFSLMLGCVIAVAIATAGVLAARALWPAYVAAEAHKQYTLALLFTRLAVGAVSVAVAACGTTAVCGDRGRAAWWLGGVFFVLSVPSHVYPGYAWNDYPVWYHLLYLGYLVPVAGWSARLFRKGMPCKPDLQPTEI